jgi:hypothetical protein
MDWHDRAERIAENEAAFRHLNEQLGVMGVFVCECGDEDCRMPVQMPRERYEQIRAHPRRFFVRPGHEKPDVETVIERDDEFLVIEKPEAVDHIVDPD